MRNPVPSFVRGCLLGAALLFAGAAVAQSGQGESEIVVTGTRDLHRELRDFVSAMAKAPPRGQLARFGQAVCPAAFGLPPQQKEAVAGRMRRIAEGVTLRVGAAGCTPNVLVIVTDDKRAFIKALAREHGYLFGNMSGVQVRRLMREPGPATAWQIDGPPLDRDGIAVPVDFASGVPIKRTTAAPSRITAAERKQFTAAAVVVQRSALDGLTTTQLADYAAMRALAQIDPTRLAGVSPPTILKALDAPMGSAVPITLTAWDLGYLRGLYASPGNLLSGAQRSEIRRHLEKEVARSADSPN